MTAPPSRPRVRSFRQEREFGLLVGGIFAALGLWWTYRDKFAGVRPWFLGVGLSLVALGALWPRSLTWPYRGWMGLAEQLAKVVTAVILGVVFFLVVTPIGVFKRLTGWDPLERRLTSNQPVTAGAGTSYWRPYAGRQHDPKHFDRMF